MLRGFDSKVPYLQNQLVVYCCDDEAVTQFSAAAITFEQAKGRMNLYTTTLHVINSGIVKTSKLTFATKVYRGVSGMALPDKFWTDNEYDVKGGIEAAVTYLMPTFFILLIVLFFYALATGDRGQGLDFLLGVRLSDTVLEDGTIRRGLLHGIQDGSVISAAFFSGMLRLSVMSLPPAP